jgi:hypothetical protein
MGDSAPPRLKLILLPQKEVPFVGLTNGITINFVLKEATPQGSFASQGCSLLMVDAGHVFHRSAGAIIFHRKNGGE